MINKIFLRLKSSTLIVAIMLSSVTINTKPAVADDDWMSVLGAFIGGFAGSAAGNSSSSGNKIQNVSQENVEKAGHQMLIAYGLTPTKCSNPNVVSVTLRNMTTVCGIANNNYPPGTYRLTDDFQLVAYGMTANRGGGGYNNNGGGYNNNGGGYNNNGGGYNNNNGGYNNNTLFTNNSNGTGGNIPATAFFDLGINQPVTNFMVLAQLRSLLAGSNLSESNCASIPNQVVLTVNGRYMVCAYPNSQYSAGRYSININNLP